SASDQTGTSLDHVLPFADFVQSLRSAELSIGTRDLFDLATLLERWQGTRRDQLRDAIAALLARDRSDALLVRKAFDEWFPPPASTPETPAQERSVPTKPQPKRRITPWPIAAVAIVVTITAASLLTIPEPEPTPPQSSPVAPPIEARPTPLLQIDQAPPPAPPVLPQPGRRPSFTFRWAGAVIAVLAVLAAAADRRARKRAAKSTRRLAAHEMANATGPHRYEPAVASPSAPIPPGWIEEAATIVGRGVDEGATSDQLDVDETLRLTLRAGLWPVLTFEPPPRTAAVLVLEDTAPSMEPWSAKIAFLLRMLVRERVSVEHWHFDTDPTFVSQERHGRPFPLDRLADSHAERSLLVISTGAALDAVLRQRRRLAATLRRWERRSWLNPIANRRYWPAGIAHAPMNVWPLTREGLSAAAWELAAPELAPSRRHNAAVRDVHPDDIERMKRLIAVVPYPTVALAEQMRQRFCPDVPEEVILFLAGNAPLHGGRLVLPVDEVRRLLHAQRHESPAREHLVRQYLLEVLRASEPRAGTMARNRWQLDVALQEIQLAMARGLPAPLGAVEQLGSLAEGPLHYEVQRALEIIHVPPSVTERVAEAARRFSARAKMLAPRWAFPGATAVLAALILAFTSYRTLEPIEPRRGEIVPNIEKAYSLRFVPDSAPTAGRFGTVVAERRRNDVPERPAFTIGSVILAGEQPLPRSFVVTSGNSGMYWQAIGRMTSGNWAVSDALWIPKMQFVPPPRNPNNATITIYLELPASGLAPLPYNITPADRPEATPSLGIGGVPLSLPAGTWTASINANGIKPLRQNFTVAEGDNPPLTLVLELSSNAEETLLGRVDYVLPFAASPRNVTILTPFGAAAATAGTAELPAGQYTALFHHDYYEDQKKTLIVR
ncbi:MAG TPA: hypothetical protein VFO89_12690, partial [Thermoanaerobaculia bacterium]|nr:hypothetical protein [Thermoanaerobaculia bacterium]